MVAKVSLAILAAITVKFAGAAVLQNKAVSPDASPIIIACTGTISPPEGCANISVVADTCISFTGGLTFLNNEISFVQVPAGFVCSFFDQFGCASNGGVLNPSDTVFLQGGVTDMTSAQGVAGPENFNDLASSFSCSAQDLTVDLGYAQYQGTVDTATNIAKFLGIRYAAAPIGDLRFRGPQAPDTVAGVQLATTPPNECFQAATGQSPTNPFETRASQAVPPGSEDCLFLNVYYPSNAAGTPVDGLPTLVWIHGGGYISGAGSGFNGEDIINQSNRGVVVVIIQYRLGVFGFLSGSAVKENGALNAGLLDQDFALRWVNQYITKFGGDPSKVTIWGESAGAGSVLQHVIANNGSTEPQLFRGAITSSSFLPSQYVYNDRIPELLFSEFVAQTNCTSASDSMTCLRAVPATVLAIANNNINIGEFFGTFATVPVVDGDFITQRATTALLEGRVNGQALLSVTNAFEGTVFVNQSVAVSASQYSLELFPGFGTVQADTVGVLYAGLGNEQFQVNAVQGESIFICPTYFLLNAFPGRSFKGEFAIPPGLHSNDLDYYFTSRGVPPFNNAEFIDAFAQSFTSFIINLDPNIKVDPTTITPLWNKFDVGNTEMLFNRTAAAPGAPVVQPITTASALLERCLFWNSVGNLTAQ